MKHRWWQVLLIPFTALMYVVNLLMIIVYKPSSVRVSRGCIEFVTDILGVNTLAQCLGIRVIWYSSIESRENAITRVHERIHAAQGEFVNAAAHLVLVPASLLLGGWYVLASIILAQFAWTLTYVIHFLLNFIVSRKFSTAYRGIWAEKMAYHKQDEFGQGMIEDAWGA